MPSWYKEGKWAGSESKRVIKGHLLVGNRAWTRSQPGLLTPHNLSSHYSLAEFPDNQNIDKTLPVAHQLQSIFATTEFQQNLEIWKFVFMGFDVFYWKKDF